MRMTAFIRYLIAIIFLTLVNQFLEQESDKFKEDNSENYFDESIIALNISDALKEKQDNADKGKALVQKQALVNKSREAMETSSLNLTQQKMNMKQKVQKQSDSVQKINKLKLKLKLQTIILKLLRIKKHSNETCKLFNQQTKNQSYLLNINNQEINIQLYIQSVVQEEIRQLTNDSRYDHLKEQSYQSIQNELLRSKTSNSLTHKQIQHNQQTAQFSQPQTIISCSSSPNSSLPKLEQDFSKLLNQINLVLKSYESYSQKIIALLNQINSSKSLSLPNNQNVHNQQILNQKLNKDKLTAQSSINATLQNQLKVSNATKQIPKTTKPNQKDNSLKNPLKDKKNNSSKKKPQ